MQTIMHLESFYYQSPIIFSKFKQNFLTTHSQRATYRVANLKVNRNCYKQSTLHLQYSAF